MAGFELIAFFPEMMRGKKILYVITKLELGGAQKQLLSLIRYLDREHNAIFLFTAKEGLLYNEALSIDNLKVTKSKFLERAIHQLKDLLALYELYVFIKANNIDTVHTHSSKAGILGRVAARFTNKLIVVSHHDREKGLKNYIGKADKYILIRYGIDYSEFGKDEGEGIRRELGFTTDERIGIVSGKILRQDTKTIDSTGLFLSIERIARERGYGVYDRGQFDKEGYVFGVNGAVAFYRRKMLDVIKQGIDYFDSEYRFFYEDLDLAWRAQNSWGRGFYIPRALAYHMRGGSLRVNIQ